MCCCRMQNTLILYNSLHKTYKNKNKIFLNNLCNYVRFNLQILYYILIKFLLNNYIIFSYILVYYWGLGLRLIVLLKAQYLTRREREIKSMFYKVSVAFK